MQKYQEMNRDRIRVKPKTGQEKLINNGKELDFSVVD